MSWRDRVSWSKPQDVPFKGAARMLRRFEKPFKANPFSWKSWMSYPSSLHRLCWDWLAFTCPLPRQDMVGGILIMYDLFAVPLQAFRCLEEHLFTSKAATESAAKHRPTHHGLAAWRQSKGLRAVARITLIFWTVNVGMSLTTGYVLTLKLVASVTARWKKALPLWNPEGLSLGTLRWRERVKSWRLKPRFYAISGLGLHLSRNGRLHRLSLSDEDLIPRS